jgi:hypothetical protein
MDKQKSLLSSLFDFEFKDLVYMRLARIIYKVITVLLAIFWVVWGGLVEIFLLFGVFGIFTGEIGTALGCIVGLLLWPPFAFCIWFLSQAGIRAAFEVVVVIFKIHANLVASESQLEIIAGNTAPLRNYRPKTS